MKNNSILFSLLTALLLLTAGCNTEDDPTPADNISGKWIVQSSEILGATVPGDGSYLVFNACAGTNCTGEDFNASDGTSGTISYDLSDDATTIAISDSSSDGGNFDFTWDILELTETDFRMVTNTIFGSLKMEMVKE